MVRTRHRATPAPGLFARSIARTLQALRRERKLTQAQVAFRLRGHGVDLHRSTLSRIELAQADVTVSELQALCRVYRVNVGYVMLSAELGVLLRPGLDGGTT